MMTKDALLIAYRAVLLAEYPWAQDADKLDRFLASASRTIRTTAATWNHDSPAMLKAWRSLGGKGRLTLTALRAIADEV
jgi:hypothetical protein